MTRRYQILRLRHRIFYVSFPGKVSVLFAMFIATLAPNLIHTAQFQTIAQAGASYGSGDEIMFPEPNLTVPRLAFATGKVIGNQQQIAGSSPDIPGPQSKWSIGQWNRAEVLQPGDLSTGTPAVSDSRLGQAAYSFETKDGNSRVSIYQDPTSKQYVYELYERNGVLVNGGGANLFLGAKPLPGEDGMNGTVYYDVSAKLTKASATYDTPAAEKDGSVKAQVFSGFGLQYIYPHSARGVTIFLQIPFSASGETTDGLRKTFDSCRVYKSGNAIFTIDQLLPGETALPFAADPGPLHKLEYNLNDHLSEILKQPHQCKNPSGSMSTFNFTGPLSDSSNWKIESVYIGLETENTDARTTSKTASPQGQVEVALDLAGLNIWRKP